MKSISAIHPAITENTENMPMKHMPHISICKSYNASILTMMKLYHSIVSKEQDENCLCDP